MRLQIFAAIIAGVVFSSCAAHQVPLRTDTEPAVQKETGPLSLPDYTTPPFGAGKDIGRWPVAYHPEFGKLQFTLHATSKTVKIGAEAVYVGSDGDILKYAEWHFLSADGDNYLIYAYVYHSGVWVFERLVVRPVIRE